MNDSLQPLSPAANRMRLHRERRRIGLRCLTIELRETEIDALIRKGLLRADMRNDPSAVTKALYAHLHWGDAVTRNWTASYSRASIGHQRLLRQRRCQGRGSAFCTISQVTDCFKMAERHLQREAAALGLKLSVNDADDSKPH